jgi:predicted dehydrogenase
MERARIKTYQKAGDIKVAVVGYGGAFQMGRQHLASMKKVGMKPTAVADPDVSRLDAARSDFPGISTFPSLDELLAGTDVDLVSIITPHDSHARLALQCLKAGRHVICEKPLAITTAEADTMIRAAQRSGVMLSAYHNRHWDSRILHARELVLGRGAIGDIIRIDCHMGGYQKPGDWWRGSRSISGGILHDWGVHLLEYALQLIDAPLVEVSGFAHQGFWAPQTAWKDDTIEDEGFLVARFASGQWVTLRITQIDSNPPPGLFKITGTTGSLVVDWKESILHQRRKDRTIVTHIDHPPDREAGYFRNIAAFLTGKAPLIITAEWARRPVHIIDLAMQSARHGRAIKAKYP